VDDGVFRPSNSGAGVCRGFGDDARWAMRCSRKFPCSRADARRARRPGRPAQDPPVSRPSARFLDRRNGTSSTSSQDGAVTVSAPDEHGKRVQPRPPGSRHFFGEISLLGRRPAHRDDPRRRRHHAPCA
jgi:hypothetical protein